MLIYYDTDTQSANFQCNPFNYITPITRHCDANILLLGQENPKDKFFRFSSNFSSFCNRLTVKCRFVA